MPIRHAKVSAKTDGGDSSLVLPSDWNADLVLSSFELSVVTASPSASQNDYSPTGWDGSHPARATVLRLTPSATILLTGLGGGTSGRLARIENDSTDYMVILVPQSTSSTAANRFAHPSRTPIFLLPGDWVDYIWDSADSRWEVVSGSRTPDLRGQFDVFDDFIAGIGTFGTIVSGTGASGQTNAYLANSTERPMGTFQVDTGTVANGRAFIGSGSSNSIVPAQGCALYLTRCAVEALSTGTERFQVFAGLHDGAAGTNTTDGVYWAYRDDVSAAWQRSVAAASSRTETAGSTTVDTNYVWLGIFINANWSRADYFISTDSATWTIEGSISSGLPSATQLVNIGVGINKTVGTTQRNLSVDLQGVRYDMQRG